MAIPVSDSTELQNLLETLARELVEASIFFRLYRDLVEAAAADRFNKEMHQSLTFWQQTVAAHRETAVFRLCKIFDQRRDSLNVRSVLETIRANPHFFSAERFEERMGQRAHVEHTPLDRAQLDKDIDYAGEQNPLVARLVGARNNFYAHRSAQGVLDAEIYDLTLNDVATLLDAGLTIINRYNISFRAHAYSDQIVGHDDYGHVLEAVRDRLQTRQRELDEQCRAYGLDPQSI